MPRTRRLILFTLLTLVVTALAACGAAPQATAPQAAPAPTAALTAAAPTQTPAAPPVPSATALSPDDALMATIAAAPTAPPRTPTPTSAPLADTNPAKPDDKTQGRLRISNCVWNGTSVDMLINGKLTVNGGVVQQNLGQLNASGYQYLAPGTYSVAIAPTGEGIDKALIEPLDVEVEAGHRYTLALLGQADEPKHTPLVIDETEAYQKAGISTDTWGEIVINNIKGAATLSFIQDGTGPKDVPFGQFAAAAMPAGPIKDFRILVGSDTIENIGAVFNGRGSDQLDCFAGTYPGPHDTHTTQSVSTLPLLDYLQLQSDFSAKNAGQTWAYTTFLTAIKTAGLTDLLTTGGPYLLLVPRDEAFAVLPKDKLDALLADPKALADMLRGHIVEGYFPSGTMNSTPGFPGFNRTVRNLRGEQLTLTGDDEGLSVNGVMTGPTQPIFVANGTRIMSIGKLLLPEPTGTTADSPIATASDVPSSSAEIILTGHTSRVSQASFVPDGKTVVTSSDDGTARLWDAATSVE